jgi:hypothetical protein
MPKHTHLEYPPNAYAIRLSNLDLFQLLDGLALRAESWERTARYLRTEEMPHDDFFLVEECSSPEEAENIAAHYRSIMERINQQMKEQR